MHTKSSKQVLSPLADAVSALIIIISDSEITGNPTPDLSQLSKAVDTQIKNLVSVAERISSQNQDETMKNGMPKACEVAKQASALLLQATSTLFSDPVSTKGRNDLLEAAKGILKGTTLVLEVFDESEILKITTATALLRNLLNMIQSQTLNPEQEAAFVHILKRTAQAVTSVCQQSNKRVKELISPRLAKDLKETIGSIGDVAAQYLHSCELLVKYPSKVAAKKLFIGRLKNLERVSLIIDQIVTCKDADEYYRNMTINLGDNLKKSKYSELLAELLNEPISNKWKQDGTATKSLCNDFVEAVHKEKDAHAENLMLVRNPGAQHVLDLLIINMEDGANGLITTIAEASHNYNEKKLDHNSLGYVKLIDACVSGLGKAIESALIGELCVLFGELSDHNIKNTIVGVIASMYQARDGNLDVERFVDAGKHLVAIVEAIHKSVDPSNQFYGDINTLIESSKGGMELVVDVANLWIESSKDENIFEFALKTLDQYCATVRNLKSILAGEDGIFSSAEILKGLVLLVNNISAKGELKDHGIHVAELASRQLMDMLKKEIENTDDEIYRQALGVEAESFGKVVRSLETLKDENSDDDDALDSFRDALKQAGGTIVKYKGGDLKEVQVPVMKKYVEPKQENTAKFNELKDALLSQPFSTRFNSDPNGAISLCDEFKNEAILLAENRDKWNQAESKIAVAKYEEIQKALVRYIGDFDETVKQAGKIDDNMLNNNTKEYVEVVNECIKAIDKIGTIAWTSELLGLLTALSEYKGKDCTTIGAIHNGVKGKNISNIKVQIPLFETQSRKMISMVDDVVNNLSPGGDKINTLNQFTKTLSGKLIKNLFEYVVSPSAKIASSVEDYAKTVKNLKNAIFAENDFSLEVLLRAVKLKLDDIEEEPGKLSLVSVKGAFGAGKQMIDHIARQIAETNDPEYEEKLDNLALRIGHISDEIVSKATEMTFQNPSPGIKESMKKNLDELKSVCLEAADVIIYSVGGDLKESTIPIPKLYKPRVSSSGDRFDELFRLLISEPVADKWKHDFENTKALISEYTSEGLNRAEQWSEPMKMIRTQAMLEYLTALKSQIGVTCNALNELVLENEKEFNEEKLNHNAKEYINSIRTCTNGTYRCVKTGILGEMFSVLGQLSDCTASGTTIQLLHNALSINEPTKLGDHHASYKQDEFFLEELALHSLKYVSPGHPAYQAVLDQISLVKKRGQIAIDATDPNSSLDLNSKLDSLQSHAEAVKDLQKILIDKQGVFSRAQILDGAMVFLNINKKHAGTEVMSKAINAANLLIKLLRSGQEDSKNKPKKDADIAIAKIEKLMPEFFKLAELAIGEDFDISRDGEELQKIVNELCESFQTAGILFDENEFKFGYLPNLELIGAADNEVEVTEEMKKKLLKESEKDLDSHLLALTRGVKELVIVNEEAPKELSEAEAEKAPIKAAGQGLKVEASHWDAEDNEIVKLVYLIANKFLDLSAHHEELSAIRVNPQAKKAFIQTGQDIVHETNKLVKAVDPIINCCADKRLRVQIGESSKKILTLAQTLKVIVAVKASSPRDRDRAVQLVTNAQNLVQSVKMVLRDAISCTLRLKPDSPSDLARFRKVIYARGIKQ